MISYRLARPDDRQFIVSGWSASYRMSRDSVVPMPLWAKLQHEVVGYYLDQPGVFTMVAAGSVQQGFIVYEPGYVYYVYVSQPFRRNGIARGLFAAAKINPESRFGYLSRTRMSWELLTVHKKCPLAQFDPYHARYSKEPNEQRDAQR